MFSFFRKLFPRRQQYMEQTPQLGFAARFHRFKLFLSAYLEAYSEMMTFEERLAGESPLGMPFLRMSTAKLTVATMQCILQLNALSEGRYNRLNSPFAALRGGVQDILAQGAEPIEGPWVVPYTDLGHEHLAYISPHLTKLEALRKAYPEALSPGFVITGAAWWQYFNDPDLHDEVDRIMLISQDDPASFSEAAATIRERLLCSFPLADALKEAIKESLDPLRELLTTPGKILLIRCLPVRADQGALVMPEQVLRTPITDESIFSAIHAAFAGTYRPRAMIYRLKLGIRDRALPFCLSCTLLPEQHARGSAHRALEPAGSQEILLHVRRGVSDAIMGKEITDPEGALLSEDVRGKVNTFCHDALNYLVDAPVAGSRHELFWAASAQGTCHALGVISLSEPQLPILSPPADAPCLPEENPIQGGLSTYPGTTHGKVFSVRNVQDALEFPIGSILLVGQAAPRWSFLLDFAKGAIAGDGTGNGLFARTARRYGRPTILHLPEACETLNGGETVILTASSTQPSLVQICPTDVTLPSFATSSANTSPSPGTSQENNPASTAKALGHTDAAPYLWLPDGAIPSMARQLAPRIVSLTLPDTDDPNFRAENCTTFHDFLLYCHDHAVQEMFRYSTSRKTSQAPSKQLVCDVPKQFWMINLDDGFHGEIKSPAVQLAEVASIPFLSFWEGFSYKPWDGPPPLDAKGFLSVLFEASANPSLDPASQSTQYTEKNVFLIAKRFCSMRCRFGFHFLALDCLLGERAKERFIVFQFKGGAANLARRVRRVHFVAELLAQFNFVTEIMGDILTARLEQGEEAEFLSALRVLGYICMHTRQLDMIMTDEAALSKHRLHMLEDMLTLAAR